MFDDILFPQFYDQVNNSDNITETNYNDLDEFKNSIFAYVKILLYRSEFINAIEFLETKMQNFFARHQQFKLFLYKSHFFTLILNNACKEEIDCAYKEFIYNMIYFKSNFQRIQENLRKIAENPIIVKSRCYKQVWEECCSLFQIGIELAVNERFKKDKNNNPFSCGCLSSSNEKCQKCLDRWFYRNKCGKLETIEEDILIQYFNTNRKHSYEYTSSSEDDKQILNYALYMNKISNISRNNVGRCTYRNNDREYDPNQDYSMPFEANDIMLMNISDDEARPIPTPFTSTSFTNNNNTFTTKPYSYSQNDSDKGIININKNNKFNSGVHLFKVEPKSSNSTVYNYQNTKMSIDDEHNINSRNNKTSIHSAHNCNVRFITNTINTPIFERKNSTSIKISKTSNSILSHLSKQNQINQNTSNINPEKYLQKSKWKEYQFRCTKRENIDKKILRKFRKYLKTQYKENNIDIVNWISRNTNNNNFWFNFIKYNLLPPFTYKTEDKEFKSFSTAYMVWIFEHQNSVELYNWFIKSNFQSLINHFTRWYHLNNNDEDMTLLKVYINTWGIIFANISTSESTVSSSTNTEFIFEDKPKINTMAITKSYRNASDNNHQSNSLVNTLKEDPYNRYDIFQELINSNQLDNTNKTNRFNSKSIGYIQEASTISNLMLNCNDGEEWNEYDENDEDFYSDSN